MDDNKRNKENPDKDGSQKETGTDQSGKSSPAVSKNETSSGSSARSKTVEKQKKKKNNLKKLRLEAMMSKAELARRANLSVLTIDRIEKGFGCRMDTKRKILEALGLKLKDRNKVFEED